VLINYVKLLRKQEFAGGGGGKVIKWRKLNVDFEMFSEEIVRNIQPDIFIHHPQPNNTTKY